jgi:hypothetical protein
MSVLLIIRRMEIRLIHFSLNYAIKIRKKKKKKKKKKKLKNKKKNINN